VIPSKVKEVGCIFRKEKSPVLGGFVERFSRVCYLEVNLDRHKISDSHRLAGRV
jgi:hypothetical protein